jgi:hypothetical protein
MNKKLLLLSTLLTSSLAFASLQANWQDWIPSKKALLIGGAALTGATAIKYLFYRKSMEMVNIAEDEIAETGYTANDKCLRATVTLEAHGSTEDLHNNYSFYLTNHDKSTWHKIVNWFFVERSIKHSPSARSKADQY